MNRIICTLLVFAVAFGCWQPAQAKSLAELLPGLLEKHDRIKAIESAREAAGHNKRAVEGGYYPNFNVSGDFAHENVDGAGSTHATQKEKNTQTFKLSQLLMDFGATGYSVEQSELTLQMAGYQEELTRQQLILEGSQAYLDSLRQHQKLGYARQSEQNIMRQTDLEDALVKRGAGLASDVLQAKQQLQGAMALRVIVEGALSKARNRFRAVYGFPVSVAEIKDFKRPPAPFGKLPASLEEAVEAAYSESPQLLMAMTNIRLADKAVDLSRTTYFPTFNAFSEIDRKDNDAGTNALKETYTMGVDFSWNLFNGGSDQAAERSARASLRQARFTLADTRNQVEEAVRSAWDDLLTNRRVTELKRNQANLAGEFLEIARKERKMGKRELIDVLANEVNYINAISEAVSAETDTMLAAYNLLLSMGRLKVELFQE